MIAFVGLPVTNLKKRGMPDRAVLGTCLQYNRNGIEYKVMEHGHFEEMEKAFPPLSELRVEDRRALEEKSEIRKYSQGTVMHSKESSLDSIIFVQKGLVNVYTTVKGKGDLLLFFVKEGSGCVFAAPKLLENVKMDFVFRAVSDCTVILVPQDQFHSFEKKYPALFEQVDRLLAMRLERIVSVMELVAFSPLEERLRIYLRTQMEAYGSDTLLLSHESVSRDLGTRREVVSRILSYYKDIGAVSLSRRKIRILDSGFFSD